MVASRDSCTVRSRYLLAEHAVPCGPLCMWGGQGYGTNPRLRVNCALDRCETVGSRWISGSVSVRKEKASRVGLLAPMAWQYCTGPGAWNVSRPTLWAGQLKSGARSVVCALMADEPWSRQATAAVRCAGPEGEFDVGKQLEMLKPTLSMGARVGGTSWDPALWLISPRLPPPRLGQRQ